MQRRLQWENIRLACLTPPRLHPVPLPSESPRVKDRSSSAIIVRVYDIIPLTLLFVRFLMIQVEAMRATRMFLLQTMGPTRFVVSVPYIRYKKTKQKNMWTLARKYNMFTPGTLNDACKRGKENRFSADTHNHLMKMCFFCFVLGTMITTSFAATRIPPLAKRNIDHLT